MNFQVLVQLSESDMEDCDTNIDGEGVEEQDVDYDGEEEDIDDDNDGGDGGVSNPAPSFPLQLENDGEELLLFNPKSCKFCGQFFSFCCNLDNSNRASNKMSTISLLSVSPHNNDIFTLFHFF